MTDLLTKTKNDPPPGALNPAKTTRMLLRLIRALEPISRIEIARRIKVNRSTITEIVSPLINGGIIREGPIRADGVSRPLGRPPIGLSLNDTDDFFVGLNLGVRRSQLGLSTINGEVLAEEEFETPTDPAKALETARNRIRELCSGVEDRTLRAIGISVPGPTDESRRKLLYAPHLGWSGIAVADELGFGEVITVVENDSTAAAMYESRLKLRNSAENSLNDFILVRSGTGIGVGLVIDDEIYRGTGRGSGFAGEFGHMTIVAGGEECVCGNRGCWEKYASASTASAIYSRRASVDPDAAPLKFVDIVALANSGDTVAQETLEMIGEYLGIGIANAIMGIGVNQVVVSGRLVYGWKFIREPLHNAVRRSIVGKTSHWSVECGEPKGSAIGGALEIAIEEYIASGLTISHAESAAT
ncbi:MAG: ROK family transcriptional regulator [Pyrinomonadaceae bacterium]